MARKIIAVVCCVALLASGPGAGSLVVFAASTAYTATNSGSPYIYMNNHWVALPSANSLSSNSISLPDLNDTIQKLDLSKEMKIQAQQTLGRLAPYLNGRRPQEVTDNIQSFLQRAHQPGANAGVLLTEFFDHLTSYANRMEEGANFTRDEEYGDKLRVRSITNINRGLVQQDYIYKLTSTVQRVEVYVPDSQNPGEKVLDQVAYLITHDGVTQEKVVWSRKLLNFATKLKRVFYDRPDVVDQLSDPDIKAADKKKLESSLQRTRETYEKAGIGDIIEGLGGTGERFKVENIPLQQVKERAKQIENWQVALQGFYPAQQLEDMQKQLLAEVILYFTQKLNLQYNPLENKGQGTDITRMSSKEVQDRLNDFEKGTFGWSFLGDALSKKLTLHYRTMDAEMDMDPPLRQAVNQAIRFLGYAADANERLQHAMAYGAGHEEKSAALQELDQWIRLAQIQMQNFELLQSSTSLEQLRDGKGMDVRLREADKPEANELIQSARNDFQPKFEDLEKRSEDNLLANIAVSFKEVLQKARYQSINPEDLKDCKDAMIAKAKEMQALFLAKSYAQFVGDSSNLAKYTADYTQKNAANYTQMVRGGLYAYFLDHENQQTRNALQVFDRVIGRLEALSADPSQARIQLQRVQEDLPLLFTEMKPYFDSLKKSDGLIPASEDVQKSGQQLEVFQTWLGNAVQQFSSNVDLFSGLNQMDLELEKNTTSKNSPETRGDSKLGYVMSFDWMNPVLGAFGWRDKVGDTAARLLTPEAYAIIGSPEKKDLRAKILDEMRNDRYIEAEEDIQKIDPKRAEKAEKRFKMSETKDLDDEGRDMQSLLTHSPSGLSMAAAQGVMQSAQNSMGNYILAHMAGTAVFDFAALTLVEPVAGAMIARTSSLVARTLTEGALRVRSVTSNVMKIERGANFVSRGDMILRPLIAAMEFGSRTFDGLGTRISKALQLPEAGKVVNRGSLAVTAVKNTAKFNAKSIAGIAAFGGVSSYGMHAWNPNTSGYASGWEAFYTGAVGNAAWGAKASWAFTLTPPASAIKGGSRLSRAYKYWGTRVGVLEMLSDGLARAWIGTDIFVGGLLSKANAMVGGLLGGNVAKAIVKSENGVWGILGEKSSTLTIGKSTNFFGTVATGSTRNLAKVGLRIGTFADNIATFTLFTSAVQEVVQAGYYYGWSTWHAEGPKSESDFTPSAHLQSVIEAHQVGEAFNQVAFLAIPQGARYSNEEVRRSRESMYGLIALHDLNGIDGVKLRNTFFNSPIGGSILIDVPVDWRQTGSIRAIGRKILGKQTVEVTATSDAKLKLSEMMLRQQMSRGTVGRSELLAIVKMLETDSIGARGNKRKVANYQLFWTPDELRQALQGIKVIPHDRLARQEAKANGTTYEVPTRDDAVFLIPELRDAASKLLGEELAKKENAALAKSIREADPEDTLPGGQVRKPLIVDGVSINDPEVIRDIQQRLAAVQYSRGEETVRTQMLKGLQKEEPQFQREMDDLTKKMEKVDSQLAGIKDANLTTPVTREAALRQLFDAHPSWGVSRELGRIDRDNNPIKRCEKLEDLYKSKSRGDFSRGLEDFVDNVWTGSKPSGRDENLSWAMDKLQDNVKAEMFLRFSADRLRRDVGRLSDSERPKAVRQFVDSIDVALSWGDIKNKKGQVMNSLRSVQRQALMSWADAVLSGNKREASKTFTFLQASGGKTLLAYTAFVPYELARGEKNKRKLWFTTSNDLLAEQFKEDWTAFSGGRPPDFKVTPLADAIFEEVFRLDRGERSIGYEYNPVVDEADENFRKPSNSIGEPNGALSENNPLTAVRIDGLQRIEGLGRIGSATSEYVLQQIDGMSRTLAENWRASMQSALRSDNKTVRDEATKVSEIIQESYGRFYRDPYKVGSKSSRGVIGDDGVESFFRKELVQHYNTLAMRNKGEKLKIELEKGKITPINYASAMPTLATEDRATAQLLAIKLREVVREKRREKGGPLSEAEAEKVSAAFMLDNLPRATQKEFMELLQRQGQINWGDKAQVDNPLKTKKLPTRTGEAMTLKEFFQRVNDAGADITMFSGTAGQKVKDFLSTEIGVRFANTEGETTMPKRSFMIVDSDSRKVTEADSNGQLISKRDAWSGLKKFKVDSHAGALDPASEDTIRLMLHLARENEQQGEKQGKNSLAILAPRTMDEYVLLRKAIHDNIDLMGVTEQEIVAFYPDFVQQGREEYEFADTIQENNLQAMENGTAKIVLLVPEIGGRGVDLPFQSEDNPNPYMKILMIGENVHQVPVIEDIQAKARPGPGRVGDAEVGYVDIASTKGLLADATYFSGPNSEARKVVSMANEINQGKKPEQPKDENKDIFDARLRTAQDLASNLPENAIANALQDDDRLAQFATSAKVYRIMVGLSDAKGRNRGAGLQEIAQLEANRTSGILDPVSQTWKDIGMGGVGIALTGAGITSLAALALPVVFLPGMALSVASGVASAFARPKPEGRAPTFVP